MTVGTWGCDGEENKKGLQSFLTSAAGRESLLTPTPGTKKESPQSGLCFSD